MTHFDTNGAPDYRDSPAPTYQQVIARDPIEAPASLRQIHPTHIEMPRVPRERYTSQTFFDLEKERMWARTWQVACRVEEVREVGDCVLYDSPGASLIIMRSAPDVIKAFYNGCLHRGMKLCASDTSVNKIRCPYHGMTWNLDGSFQNLPARWDFDPVEDSELALPEARVGLWGGFVFINRDPASPSLETYLGPLIAEFADWSRDDVYLDTRVTKVMEANWKCCMEGFIEAFHVAELHSQALPFGGDASTQYDVWADNGHVSRFCAPTGIPSDQYPQPITEAEIWKATFGAVTGDTDNAPPLPEGKTARGYLADMNRTELGKVYGRDFSHLTDAEACDPIQYSLFPNFLLFKGLPYPFAYRFVPIDNSPDRTRFDFMIFRPKPQDGSNFPEVNHIDLGPNDTYAASGAFQPWHGLIYDQDCENLALQQQGLKAGGVKDVMLSRYQEVRIRFLHKTLMEYLDRNSCLK